MSANHQQLGSWGEQQATKFLQKQNYQVLATNYHLAGVQIDIVAFHRASNVLVLVEVKTRRQLAATDKPLISWQQLARLRRASLAASWRHPNHQIRIDLIAILAGKIQHWPNITA